MLLPLLPLKEIAIKGASSREARYLAWGVSVIGGLPQMDGDTAWSASTITLIQPTPHWLAFMQILTRFSSWFALDRAKVTKNNC